jgi:hypothetical protein
VNKSNKSLYFEAVIVYPAHGLRVLTCPALALKPVLSEVHFESDCACNATGSELLFCAEPG